MNSLTRRSSTVLIVTGFLAIIFGIIAAVWPISTAITLVVIWGAYALVDGVTSIVMAFRAEGASAKVWLVITGIFGIIAGLFAMFQPLLSGIALAWVVGVWLMVRGIAELVGAFSETNTSPRWLLILGGVAWFIAGLLFVANPGTAGLSVALWLGVLAIAWGIVTVVAGFMLRSQVKKSNADAAA